MSDPLLLQKYDALTRQLERARATQERYFGRFFFWLILSGFLFLALFLSPFGSAHILLPFLVLTAGVQASFYLHFVDLARLEAAATEERLNALLGEDLLVTGRLEAVYLYPLDQPKISGLILSDPLIFFSAFTLHWLFLWSFFYLFGLLRAWDALGNYRPFYLTLLASWTLLNLGYLAWYFLRQRDLKRAAAQLPARAKWAVWSQGDSNP